MYAFFNRKCELAEFLPHFVRVIFDIKAANYRPDVRCLFITKGVELQAISLKEEEDGSVLFIRPTPDTHSVYKCK